VGAVERVAVALHGDLIAIIDAGHAGQREQQRIGQQLPAHGVVHAGQRDATPALPEAVTAVGRLVGNGGDGALGVVGGEEVHGAVERGLGVVFADRKDGVGHGGGVRPAHKVDGGVAERIVHRRVQTVPAQIGAAAAPALLGGGVLPYFADQQFVRAVGFDGGADLFNEIVGQLVGNVQAEAGRAQAQ